MVESFLIPAGGVGFSIMDRPPATLSGPLVSVLALVTDAS